MLYNNINMIEIKTSSIKNAGKGVFATENIQRGDIITEYVGKKFQARSLINNIKKMMLK